MPIHVRAVDRTKDRRGIEAIDTSFETDTIFELLAEARSLRLVERSLSTPLIKRYEIGEIFAPWARWKRGWVAEDAALCGFAAVEYEPWRQRLILWFLYVQPASRQQGVGRALLEQVEACGRELGATHVWLETSNVNVPAVRAYNRLGYTLCGADTRYYGDYMPGETALFLAKPLDR